MSSLLRRTAFDKGIAIPFIIVATLALWCLLLGWHMAWNAIQRRHS